MKQSLAKWKMARSHRLKRADAWHFRPGPSFARLEESHKLRVQIRAEERANKRPVKIQLVEAQMENAQLKALLEDTTLTIGKFVIAKWWWCVKFHRVSIV